MKVCKYCGNRGKFYPITRQVLCDKHRRENRIFWGEDFDALTPEGESLGLLR